MLIFERDIKIKFDDIKSCLDFAEKFSNKGMDKSSKDFGSVSNRKINDMKADTFEGKIAEVAFKKFLEINSIKVGDPLKIDVDFGIESGYMSIDDGQDIKAISYRGLIFSPKVKYDVKSTRMYSKWLLVESHKRDEKLIDPDVYVLVKVDLPRDLESNFDHAVNEILKKGMCKCEISGYAMKKDFYGDDGRPIFIFNRNERLMDADQSFSYIYSMNRCGIKIIY